MMTEFTSPHPGLSDVESWQIGDGILLSICTSMVLWSFILASVYEALG